VKEKDAHAKHKAAQKKVEEEKKKAAKKKKDLEKKKAKNKAAAAANKNKKKTSGSGKATVAAAAKAAKDAAAKKAAKAKKAVDKKAAEVESAAGADDAKLPIGKTPLPKLAGAMPFPLPLPPRTGRRCGGRRGAPVAVHALPKTHPLAGRGRVRLQCIDGWLGDLRVCTMNNTLISRSRLYLQIELQ